MNQRRNEKVKSGRRVAMVLAALLLSTWAPDGRAVSVGKRAVRSAKRPKPPLPKAYRLLGTKCPRGTTRVLPVYHHGFGRKMVCGSNGRVVAVFSGPYHWSYRRNGKTIYQANPRGRFGPNLTVGHIGNTVWIAKIRCPGCRRIMGFTAVVRLNRLNRVQRRAFNQLLGLSPKVNLKTLKKLKRALHRFKPGYWARPNPVKRANP